MLPVAVAQAIACSQHVLNTPISIPKQFGGGDVLHLGTYLRSKEFCVIEFVQLAVCSACSTAEELDVFFSLRLNMGEPLFSDKLQHGPG